MTSQQWMDSKTTSYVDQIMPYQLIMAVSNCTGATCVWPLAVINIDLFSHYMTDTHHTGLLKMYCAYCVWYNCIWKVAVFYSRLHWEFGCVYLLAHKTLSLSFCNTHPYMKQTVGGGRARIQTIGENVTHASKNVSMKNVVLIPVTKSCVQNLHILAV